MTLESSVNYDFKVGEHVAHFTVHHIGRIIFRGHYAGSTHHPKPRVVINERSIDISSGNNFDVYFSRAGEYTLNVVLPKNAAHGDVLQVEFQELPDNYGKACEKNSESLIHAIKNSKNSYQFDGSCPVGYLEKHTYREDL